MTVLEMLAQMSTNNVLSEIPQTDQIFLDELIEGLSRHQGVLTLVELYEYLKIAIHGTRFGLMAVNQTTDLLHWSESTERKTINGPTKEDRLVTLWIGINGTKSYLCYEITRAYRR